MMMIPLNSTRKKSSLVSSLSVPFLIIARSLIVSRYICRDIVNLTQSLIDLVWTHRMNLILDD